VLLLLLLKYDTYTTRTILREQHEKLAGIRP